MICVLLASILPGKFKWRNEVVVVSVRPECPAKQGVSKGANTKFKFWNFSMDFFVYILRCNDNSYYVGHTDDIEKRISEHQQGLGSGHTSSRLPVQVVYVQVFGSRSEALEAERQIKKWTRAKKEALFEENWPKISKLALKKFK